jgi:hypothetical protein
MSRDAEPLHFKPADEHVRRCGAKIQAMAAAAKELRTRYTPERVS